MTLACEDGDSKLVEVVTVADVGVEVLVTDGVYLISLLATLPPHWPLAVI